MKYSFAAASLLAAGTTVIAAPTGVDYSKIDYSHVDYSDVDFSKLDYSHVDYSKVPFDKLDYSHVDYSKVPFDKLDYSKVDFGKVPYPGKDKHKGGNLEHFPLAFTSTYYVVATPDQVVNASDIKTGGLKGAKGYYSYGINSKLDLICYYIELEGFRGEYQSPAKTATHIHQADVHKNGPPRIAFPNPTEVPGNHNLRRSVGCLQGPFKTGVNVEGTTTDTGDGFKLSQIEANPSNFFTDVHSSLAVPGAVRGQLA